MTGTSKPSAVPEVRLGDVAHTAGALVKAPGLGNPLRDYRLGADPYAIVYDGRVYLYMSSDEYVYDNKGDLIENNFSMLNRVFAMSSDDMVNWTDHGAIPVAGARNLNDGQGIAKWAGGSWAPAAAYKRINGEDKFFLYFADSAGGIGVLTADSPIGPWRDPLGKALVTHSTPGVAGVVWLFDPAVLVDDDGKAYLYFGGGVPGGRNPTQEQVADPRTVRVIQLGDDMISTVGAAAVIEAPYVFEDSGIHKYGKYYSCTDFGPRPHGKMCRRLVRSSWSATANGTVQVRGQHPQVLSFLRSWWNNHRDLRVLGQWYMLYTSNHESSAWQRLAIGLLSTRLSSTTTG